MAGSHLNYHHLKFGHVKTFEQYFRVFRNILMHHLVFFDGIVSFVDGMIKPLQYAVL